MVTQPPLVCFMIFFFKMEVHNITIAQQLMFVVAVELKMVKTKPEMQTSISVEVTNE